MGSAAQEVAGHNRVMMRKLLVFAALMFGFGYAMVPLYEKICQVTGINNLLNPDDLSGIAADPGREVRLDFDANSRGDVAFRPLTRTITANPGKTYSVIYEIENLRERELTGQSVPSFAPARAQPAVRKLECFCFYRMTLKPREKIMLPVVFSVDPSLDREIRAVALSYTFFEVEGTNS